MFIDLLKMNNLFKKNLQYLLLGIILIIHSLILTKLIFFPYPELFVYPYLTNNGLIPYSQILDQHFPGLMFLPANFNNLGMTDEVSARFWLIGIVLLTHLFLFFITKFILKDGKKALLVNFLYLLWQPFFEGWVLWIDNFIPLFLLPTFYFILKKKFFTAGLFLGLGITTKQTIIPLAGLIFLYLLFTKDFRALWRYSLGSFIPVGLMLIYIFSKGYFIDFWYWTVVFNLTIYAKFGTQIPTSFGFIVRVFVVYITSLIAYFAEDRRLKLILGLFLLGSLVGTFDRANFVHYQPSLPFAILATVIGIFSLPKKYLTVIGRVSLFILIGVYSVITIWWQTTFYRGHLSDKVFFFDDSTKKTASKIMEYTDEKDKIFVFGGAPHLYQMSKTLPAGEIFVFQFPWFLKVSENRILDGIKKDQPEIIIYQDIDIEGHKITDFAKNIDQYIKQNYQKIDNVDQVEILRKI